VSLIQKCSENNGESVQLGVVRALLTVTTAEHFVLHGDALISVSCIHDSFSSSPTAGRVHQEI